MAAGTIPGGVIAWTCAAHRELARAGLPDGRRLDRWLPASIAWHPVPPGVTGPGHDRVHEPTPRT
jgi:hypothetical protein